MQVHADLAYAIHSRTWEELRYWDSLTQCSGDMEEGLECEIGIVL